VALLLALGGLLLLHLMAVNREIPAVKVGAISPMMNFAYVRVKGTVERNAYVARRKGAPDYLSFYLDDGSGRLHVVAYGETAQDLVRLGPVPKRGAFADVSGSLRVAANGRVKLLLQAPQQLRIRDSKGRDGIPADTDGRESG